MAKSKVKGRKRGRARRSRVVGGRCRMLRARRVPSWDVRVAAARTRVAVDSKNGVETPPWIRELAQPEKA